MDVRQPGAHKIFSVRIKTDGVRYGMILFIIYDDVDASLVYRIIFSVNDDLRLGNQHWPAVVKGSTVYVPLTVDRKVMLSVMETHNIDDISYEFEEGREVIPYMAPHEIRVLFGGASHGNSHIHTDHHDHVHVDAKIVH